MFCQVNTCAIDAWGCLDGPTTGWIKEMADRKVKATA